MFVKVSSRSVGFVGFWQLCCVSMTSSLLLLSTLSMSMTKSFAGNNVSGGTVWELVKASSLSAGGSIISVMHCLGGMLIISKTARKSPKDDLWVVHSEFSKSSGKVWIVLGMKRDGHGNFENVGGIVNHSRTALEQVVNYPWWLSNKFWTCSQQKWGEETPSETWEQIADWCEWGASREQAVLHQFRDMKGQSVPCQNGRLPDGRLRAGNINTIWCTDWPW